MLQCDSSTCPIKAESSLRFCPECGRRNEPQEDGDPLSGRVIANTFRLIKAIGEGAMGTIYKAEHITLQKAVVIKLLHPHLTGDASLAKRFHREAKAASLLNHPNCIGIIDFGQSEDGMLYIAMEFVDGCDLAELIHRQFPLESRRVVTILKQVCTALDEAHANGVLHRDLKPENIMITERRRERDFVKVLDFGIAKLQENSPGGAGTFQTMAGVVCGTPEYMSPEQAKGEKLDGRSDLYAIGIILYQMLTNTVPFHGESPLGVVTQHLSKAPTPPHQIVPGVSAGLERLCLSLLEKKREARPPSALDVIAELERIEREIEAGADDAVHDDRTVVQLRPSQLAELEAARNQYKAKVAAEEAAQTAAAPVAAAPPSQPTAAPARRFETEIVEPEHAAAADSGSHSNAKMWLLTVGIAVLVAVAGFFVYRAIAMGALDAELVEFLRDSAPDI